ncbi:RCC1 domain-containing protein [Saccharothrix sp. Mg75]|uniref:RCC1 domain-containing protein n=1 Tax=Saccharothrix sp. Mg75 TaxID=3445357 RepID=UPI003EE834E6
MKRVLAVCAALVSLAGGVVAGGVVTGGLVGTAGAAPVVGGSSKFTATYPARLLDTKAGIGTPVGSLGAGQVKTVDLSGRLPATTTAVVLTVTAVSPTEATTVSAYRTGWVREDSASVVNLVARETRSGSVTVAVGPDRKVDLRNGAGSVDLIVDLFGHYATDGAAKYRATQPQRAFDVQAGPASTAVVDVSAKVPAGATAAVFTLTASSATATTLVTAWRGGAARPGVRNLTVTKGLTTANLVTVQLGADRAVSLYNQSGAVRLTGDLVGYYGADGDSFFLPATPRRDFDTRTGAGTLQGNPGALAAGAWTQFFPGAYQGGQEVTSVVFNLTTTDVTAQTELTAGAYGPSVLHAAPWRPTTTQVQAGLRSAAVDIANVATSGSTHLLGDVTGYFTRTCTGTAGCAYAWVGSSEPKPIHDFPGVVAVDGGQETALLLRSDGTVWSWTSDPPTAWGKRPVRVPGLTGITKTESSNGNGLALASDGTVWSWGYTRHGQIGDGVDHVEEVVTTPVRVAGLTDVVDLGSGFENGYAVKSDGTLWAWGSNHEGLLGNGVACDRDVPATCSSNVPVRVAGLTDVVEVSDEGFALKADGTAWTWGTNYAGVLGTGEPDDEAVSTVPVRVSGLTDVVRIAGHSMNRYAVRSDGTLWAWGANSSGQMGNGVVEPGVGYRVPHAVPGLTGVAEVSISSTYIVLALTSDGTVWAWGNDIGGQLGVPDGNPAAPGRVPQVSGIGATAVAACLKGGLVLVAEPR